MYTPSFFKIENTELIYEFIKSHPLATLIVNDDINSISHIPLILDDKKGAPRLLGHMAKENPQWKVFSGSPKALILFHGPHAYISPSIYVNKLNVPTWNYIAVHIQGQVTVIEEPNEVEELVKQAVTYFEADSPNKWEYELPQQFREALLDKIVGFEISIDKIDAKFKLSQNRKPEDYEAVAHELLKRGDSQSLELLKYMRLTEK